MKRWRPQPLRSLPQRVGLSTVSLLKLLYFKPAYLLLAVTVSVVFYEIVFWFLNLGLFHYLMTTEFLTLGDKLGMIIGSYTGIFTVPISPLAITLFAVSLLQGITVAALTYSIRKERAANRGFIKELGGTGLAGILAVLGLGCSVCGTSLVMPILTFFFATSSVAVADQVGFYSAVLALIVSLIATYLSGYKLASRLEV